MTDTPALYDDALELPRDDDGRVVGYQVGKAAALSEWAIRKEIDDPDFEQLCRRLRWRKYAREQWARMSPEEKAKVRAYRKRWAEENAEQYREAVKRSKAKGRRDGATWYRRELARKRAKNAERTAERRREVHTCEECGAQWCIALGRIPTRPPKYCDRRCQKRAQYRRDRARGKR